MADYTKIIPFIKNAEGGYVNDPTDAGGETNNGVTYKTWCAFYGSDAHTRFMTMVDADWAVIFKKEYWDAVCADSINSQRIAEELAEWAWGSGRYYPSYSIQTVLHNYFGAYALNMDGTIGAQTVQLINATDEKELYKHIVNERFKFLAHIPINTPSQAKYIDGWINRLCNLLFTEVVL